MTTSNHSTYSTKIGVADRPSTIEGGLRTGSPQGEMPMILGSESEGQSKSLQNHINMQAYPNVSFVHKASTSERHNSQTQKSSLPNSQNNPLAYQHALHNRIFCFFIFYFLIFYF